MATKPSKSNAKRLDRANIAINNTLLDPEICTLVARRGYTAAKLTSLKDLYDRACAAVSTKTAAKGGKENATDQLALVYHDAHLAYQDLASTARRVLQDSPALLATLGLTGEEPRDTAGFIHSSYVLFDNAARPDLVAILSEHGYTVEFLASERAKIAAYDQANQVQEAAKGTAEGSTTDQNTLLDQLDSAVMTYFDAAKIALRDRPDLQQKIGLIQPDRKAAARKAAATRAAKKAVNKTA